MFARRRLCRSAFLTIQRPRNRSDAVLRNNDDPPAPPCSTTPRVLHRNIIAEFKSVDSHRLPAPAILNRNRIKRILVLVITQQARQDPRLDIGHEPSPAIHEFAVVLRARPVGIVFESMQCGLKAVAWPAGGEGNGCDG
ncbi:unnamed protein product [Periconia digitata]|uniref:Uncharacterized protein n=1 Tax=Periconia digitata TaxID=1303443 RepID=A0A9W4UFG7_9PLEO|nr:unnamed protein product [Periconia digitata]